MKYIMTIVSLMIFVGCFLFLMDNQDYIPLALQIIISILMVGYEFILIKLIFKGAQTWQS